MDWNALWIWLPSHRNTQNFYMYARKTFELGSDVCSAVASITCSTEYKLYINGKYIGRGPNPCDPKWQYFDQHQIKSVLHKGRNVVAVIGYNYGLGTHCRPEAPGGLLFQMDCSLDDKTKVQIISDESWRVIPADAWDFDSKQMFWTIGFQEIYDSRKEPAGWKGVDFDDSNWQKPVAIGKPPVDPWTNLVKRQIPLLKEFELQPVSVVKAGRLSPVDENDLDIATLMAREEKTSDESLANAAEKMISGEMLKIESGNTFITLDFGKEVIGFPKIKVAASSDGTIDIGYSEALDANGNVDPTRQYILQTDRLILRGGEQSFRTFGRRAFRYVQLSFKNLNSPVEIEGVSLDRVIYPAGRVGAFESSDPLLNKIWETGVYTLSVCMQDQYEDCPLREHGQYPGDARVQALINYYVYGDTKLAAKALWQFVQNQRENGFFNALWPSSTDHGLPDYNLVWVMMLKDHHDYAVDQLLLEKLFPNLEKLMDVWCPSQEDENGLLVFYPKPDVPMHEWWLFIDHAPLDKRGEVTAYNAFYYKALVDASELAARARHFDRAEAWKKRAERVKLAINERLWDEKKGVYADCRAEGLLSDTISEQANYLAILFDVADESRWDSILAYIDSDKPVIKSAGPYFNFYVLETLAKVGRYQQGLDMIRREWGEMLNRGATTWWEALDVNTPKDFVCPGSLCHAWGSAPTYWLMKHIAGIHLPDETSRRPYKLAPKLCGLDWVKASLHEVSVSVGI